MEWVWGLLAAIAVLWPGRLSGALDGVPLDGLAEAIVIGVVLPALCWFHPRVLRKDARARLDRRAAGLEGVHRGNAGAGRLVRQDRAVGTTLRQGCDGRAARLGH